MKTEVAFLEPIIYIFHDFVNDPEIERLKELANPKVRPSIKVKGRDTVRGCLYTFPCFYSCRCAGQQLEMQPLVNLSQQITALVKGYYYRSLNIAPHYCCVLVLLVVFHCMLAVDYDKKADVVFWLLDFYTML